MKQGIVKFSKEFVTETGLKEWVGIELEFDADSDPMEALGRAETIVRQYQRPKVYLMQYEPILPSQIAPQRTTEDEKIADTIKGMYACTELDGDDGLLSFRKIAASNRETQNIFDIMFTRLTAKKM